MSALLWWPKAPRSFLVVLKVRSAYTAVVSRANIEGENLYFAKFNCRDEDTFGRYPARPECGVLLLEVKVAVAPGGASAGGEGGSRA